MADMQTPTPTATGPKSKYELKHERKAERRAARQARRNDPEHNSHAGDVVGHVSNGLRLLTFGLKNPVSGGVGRVADGLKAKAGEEPNREKLSSAI